MSGLQLITLDLDNTLWDVDKVIIRAERLMREWMAENTPEALSLYVPETLAEIRTRVATRFPNQVHDLSFMRTTVLTELMSQAGHNSETAQKNASTAFDIFFAARNQVEFFEGAIDMLQTLKSIAPVYALTNGNANVKRAGIGHFLEHAISSADVGKSKPEPEMFEAAIQRAGASAERTVHIGDNLVDDIHGANQVGMHSLWVNLRDHRRDSTEPLPDREVTALDQVAHVLDELDARIKTS